MQLDFPIFASTENGGKEDPGKAGKGCEVVVVVGKSVKDARTESKTYHRSLVNAKKACLKKPLSLHGGYSSIKLAILKAK